MSVCRITVLFRMIIRGEAVQFHICSAGRSIWDIQSTSRFIGSPTSKRNSFIMTHPSGRFSRTRILPSSTKRRSILCSASVTAGAGSHRWARCRYYQECCSVPTAEQSSIRSGTGAGRTNRSILCVLPTARSRADVLLTRYGMWLWKKHCLRVSETSAPMLQSMRTSS